MKKVLILLSMMMIIFLSSCTRKIGWVGTNIGDKFNASYQFFDGKQISTLRLDAGETLKLDFELEIIKGSLILQMLDPNKNLVWQKRFFEDTSGNFTITPDIDGRYRLNVIGEETQGGFDLQWEILD